MKAFLSFGELAVPFKKKARPSSKSEQPVFFVRIALCIFLFPKKMYTNLKYHKLTKNHCEITKRCPENIAS